MEWAYPFRVRDLVPFCFDWDERSDSSLAWYRILAQLNARLAAIPGANIFAFPIPPLPGVGIAAGLEANLLHLSSGSPQELAEVSNGFLYALNQRTEISDAYSSYSANIPQYQLIVDGDKAMALGVVISDLFSTLQTQLGSQYVNDFALYGRNYRVMLQADTEFRDSIDDIRRLDVKSSAGDLVPISAVVDIQPVLGPQVLSRYNQYRAASLTVSLDSSVATGTGIQLVQQIADETLPEGYAIQWTGNTEQEMESSQYVVLIILLAVLFVYLFLVAPYESWIIPVAVMLSVIVALLGALFPLWLIPGLDNNLYAQIGILMLIGLASKSAIVIVELAKKLREETKDILDVATEAANLRFRAVMMTAVSMIMGLLPLVMATGAGADSRVSIGVVVLVGMLLATAVGILFIPPLSVLMQRFREWAKRLVG